ncbi:uncharacterized protein LOC117140785 isoform X1 [Drosophila mauritiana]|uniref:Uncharacterized protein LOC117140785 isoform X1 n=1 Tax=Drosophila mauritiana TaxID=7226 RepID=A0A6P8JUH1_DROMA|nr:uncharacterized protein LOC117140785 isoform X1 [Drosophila mauritiana]
MGKEGTTTETPVLISEAEMMERQKNYTIRMHDVAAACATFRKSLLQFRLLEEERTNQGRWDQYLRCDGLPKVRSPIEIRTFLAKIRHFEDIEAKNSIDWTMGVDERSVLSQNIYQKDLTRQVLQRTTVDNPGSYFESNLKKCMDVLQQVDILMDNEVEMERMNKSVLADLLEVYRDVQLEIESLFDRLTYRILRMQKAYMESGNGIVARWSHSCDLWRMDLWGLYNVPIIFQQLEVPLMIVDFKETSVKVQVPLSVLCDCITIRCVHTNFDHHSSHAKSYEPLTVESIYMPNAGLTDMEESVVGEWLMQNDIQEETLNNMNRRREEYEELMQLIAERTEQAAKEAKFGKGGDGDKRPKIVIPKTPKLVPLVPQGMYPDVFKEFLFREEDQYKKFLSTYFHPDNLSLTPEEVNLRECIIVGGIYNISFVRRPDQTQFEKFNIVLHEDGRVLRVTPQVVAKPDNRKSRLTEYTRMTLGTSQMKLSEEELPFFVVTVQLPPHLCRWGKPEVCHYLRELQTPTRVPDRSTLVTLNILSPIRISSELSKREDGSIQSTLANQFSPPLKSLLKQSITYGHFPVRGEPIANFNLDKSLNKIEIMKLEKMCLPRIISSFKFPSEFVEDHLTSEALKAKPNRLVKRPDTESAVEAKIAAEIYFEYETQERPERAFPTFEKTVAIEFSSADFMPSIECADKTTACGLVSTLEDIKEKYLQRPQELLDQIQVQVSKKSEKKAEKWENKNADGRSSAFSSRDRTSFANVNAKKTPLEPKTKINETDIMITISSSETKMDMARPSKPKSRRSGSVMKRRSTRKSARLEDMDRFRAMDSEPPVLLDHWTKEYIMESQIDLETNTLTFRTDRLGIFGLAFKRYEHFPFRDWCLQPSDDNPDEVILSLDTYHVRMFFFISARGVRGYVTDLVKGYTAKPVKYLDIVEPISDFRELRKLLIEKNLNIFAENDANYYITNGYFSIKHIALELHTYNTMALQCKLMKFYRSSWNRLAQRRDIIVEMKIAKDNSDYSEVTMRITPEKSTFVKISEMCSDDVNVVKLRYEETWRNVNNYNDFGQAIYSLNPHTLEGSNKDAMLFVYIKRLLNEIRPLSYS